MSPIKKPPLISKAFWVFVPVAIFLVFNFTEATIVPPDGLPDCPYSNCWNERWCSSTPAPAECASLCNCGCRCRSVNQCKPGSTGAVLDRRHYSELSAEEFLSWGCHGLDQPAGRTDYCKLCDESNPQMDCKENLCMIDKEQTNDCRSSARCEKIPTMWFTGQNREFLAADGRRRELGLYNSRDARNASSLTAPRWTSRSYYMCSSASDCCYNGRYKIKDDFPTTFPLEGFPYNPEHDFVPRLFPSEIDTWEEFQNIYQIYPACQYCWQSWYGRRCASCSHAIRATRNDDFALAYDRDSLPAGADCNALVDPNEYRYNSKCVHCPQYGECTYDVDGNRVNNWDPGHGGRPSDSNYPYGAYYYTEILYVNGDSYDCTPLRGRISGYYYQDRPWSVAYNVTAQDPVSRQTINYFSGIASSDYYGWRWDDDNGLFLWANCAYCWYYTDRWYDGPPCQEQNFYFCGTGAAQGNVFDYDAQDVEKCTDEP